MNPAIWALWRYFLRVEKRVEEMKKDVGSILSKMKMAGIALGRHALGGIIHAIKS
jgi:hypothetical protein